MLKYAGYPEEVLKRVFHVNRGKCGGFLCSPKTPNVH